MKEQLYVSAAVYVHLWFTIDD